MLIGIIICIRFMLPPCVLNVTLDLIYCLRASAASLRWGRGQHHSAKLGWCIWIDWQPFTRARDLKLRKVCRVYLCGNCSELCWNSNCSHVSLIVLRHIGESFRSSTAERERCCTTLDIFYERVVSTCRVDADVQRGQSARRTPGVSWDVNGSGRVVPSHLTGSYRFIWSRLLYTDTLSEQFIALLLNACRRSQTVSIHVGRPLNVVSIRLTARLQSLPLARCWRACFALFSSFFPLAVPSNINSYKIDCM